MKKKLVISALFFILLFSSVVLAATNGTLNIFPSSFSGTVGGSSYGYVTSTMVNDSGGTSHYAWVNWKTSSQSSAHDLYFRVVNSNGAYRGGRKFSYLETGTFSTTTTYNYGYYLQAKRENSIDPATTVTGSWNL